MESAKEILADQIATLQAARKIIDQELLVALEVLGIQSRDVADLIIVKHVMREATLRNQKILREKYSDND